MPTVIVTTALARIQTDPQGEAPVATAYFSKSTDVDGVVYQAPWDQVSWPLQSDKTVTVDGIEYPYYLASKLVTAIAYQEYEAKNTPAHEPVVEPSA